MFRLLKLPRGTTLEKLTFGYIIKVADEIIANADAIKVIYLLPYSEVFTTRPYMKFYGRDMGAHAVVNSTAR